MTRIELKQHSMKSLTDGNTDQEEWTHFHGVTLMILASMSVYKPKNFDFRNPDELPFLESDAGLWYAGLILENSSLKNFRKKKEK